MLEITVLYYPKHTNIQLIVTDSDNKSTQTLFDSASNWGITYYGTYIAIKFTIPENSTLPQITLEELKEWHCNMVFGNCAHKTVKYLHDIGVLKEKPLTRPCLLPITAAKKACNCALRAIEDQRLYIIEQLNKYNIHASPEDLIKKEIERVRMQITREQCSWFEWHTRKKQKEAELLEEILEEDPPIFSSTTKSLNPKKLVDATTNPNISSTTRKHLLDLVKHLQVHQPRQVEQARVQLAISKLKEKAAKLKKEANEKAKKTKLEDYEDPNVKLARKLADDLRIATQEYFSKPNPDKQITDNYQEQCRNLIMAEDISPLLNSEWLKFFLFVYAFIAIARKVASETTLRRFSLFQDPPTRVLLQDIRDQITAVSVPAPSTS